MSDRDWEAMGGCAYKDRAYVVSGDNRYCPECAGARMEALEAQLDAANHLLLDMLSQYCAGGVGKIDTRCVSAAENAAAHLLAAGLLVDDGNPTYRDGSPVMRCFRKGEEASDD